MKDEATGNSDRIRRWYEQVWNYRREVVIHELFHEDTIVHGITSGGAPSWGIDNFLIFYHQMLMAIPDIHFDVTHVIAEGDMTSARVEVYGTHLGDLSGFAATGRTFRTSSQCISLWRDGLVIESWNEWDQLGVLRQLGLIG